jgi:site-specific DNA-methyltransferase (adenine-specific)
MISVMDDWKNKLYYGDNLDILRKHIADESVDLIYLDPPFNSKATYNVLFEDKTGTQSVAQIEAFGDTWHWDRTTPFIFEELIMNASYPKLANLMNILIEFLGKNDMMAYLTMMAIRVIELHRVLKKTGSIYLHCDPTASHYIKLLMDAVFGYRHFQNEIIWEYGVGGVSKKRWARKHDVIFFYSKKSAFQFNVDMVREPYREKAKVKYKIVNGKKYLRKHPLGRVPHDTWDIPSITNTAKERLGYPTQKPEALLERILLASSNEGDIVLDPFCGCGTTVAVAERLNRRWIGIDITHLAINLIEKRLKDNFGDEINPDIIGTPKTTAGAEELAKRDKYQFEWWSLSLVNARPYQGKKKGADKGIDGILYFKDTENGRHKEIVVQVKGGHVTANQIRDLAGVVSGRKSAEIGIFITLKKPTTPMIQASEDAGLFRAENGRYYKRIQILTINDLLEKQKLPEYPFRDTGGFSPYKKANRIIKE